MIKAAFCDDDLDTIEALCALMDHYRDVRSCEIEYAAFQSPLELLAAVERGTRFDVLFLDVIMPGENGIEVAAELREHDKNVKIIFLTSSSEFAVASYGVNAHFYQLKPIEEESFFKVMDSALAACEKERSSSLILHCKHSIERIDPRRMEYCEVLHRTLLIHMEDGRILESCGSLDELSKQLEPFGSFLRTHRSYLVNLNYVQSLTYRGVTMSCRTELPIPRGKYNEIKNAFLAYVFENKQMLL